MKNYEFRNNNDKRRYEMLLDDGYIALIDYRVTPEGNIVLTHTEVPYKYENQGVGTELVRQSLEDIRSQGVKVLPQCGFVAAYVRRHPDWAEIVAQRY